MEIYSMIAPSFSMILWGGIIIWYLSTYRGETYWKKQSNTDKDKLYIFKKKTAF